MSVSFKHSNKVFVKKDQEGYVKEFYPKHYTILTDPYNKEIYYLNVFSKRVTIDGVDIEFSVNNRIKVDKSDITKIEDNKYMVSNEGHSNFGEIGDMDIKYEVMNPVTIIVTNEQIVKEGSEDIQMNDHVQLKRSIYKAGVVQNIKPSQVRVELINGTIKTFDVKDIFYIDIELDSNEYVQINAIKNDKIYGNTISGKNITLSMNDKQIKYKNFQYKSNETNDDKEDEDENENIQEYVVDDNEENETDMVHGFKAFEHTDIVVDTLSKDDKNIYTKIKKFIDNVNSQDCSININISSVIKIYNKVLKTLKDYLIEINSSFKNKNNLIDDSVILYLVIIYHASMLNGYDVCCVYNNYIGDTGLLKYIAFLKDHYAFNALMLKTSKFTNKNVKDIFGNDFDICKLSDPTECIIINCDNVLRNKFNLGFSNLDDLPNECVNVKASETEYIPLKPYYKMEVPGYTTNDKKTTKVNNKKFTYTEQEINQKLEEAKRKNYKAAQIQWQKLKDELLKEKGKKQITHFYEYTTEYQDFNELLNATIDDLRKKINTATVNNKLKNVERFKYILQNLLNFDNFKQQSIADIQSSKNKKDILNLYQNILFDNYKSIYTKNLLIENHNKLRMLKAILNKSNKIKSIASKNSLLKEKLFNTQNKTNALLQKYTRWFNKNFQEGSSKDEPVINMDTYIYHFKNLINKSKALIKKDEDDLDKLFGKFNISDKNEQIDEDDSFYTYLHDNSDESNTMSYDDSDDVSGGNESGDDDK